MAENISYKDVWSTLLNLKKISEAGTMAALSPDDLVYLNRTLCLYSDNYAEELTALTNEALTVWEEPNQRIAKLVPWINRGLAVSTLKLAIVLQEKDTMEIPEAAEILTYYLDTNMAPSVKALGIYNAAATFRATDAAKCYELQKKAFDIYPELAQLFGVDYVYQNNLIKDSYFEKCPICGSEESHAFYCVPQFLVLKTGNCLAPLKLWKKCQGCGNLYAYNFPVSEMGEMNGHYAKSASYTVIEPRYGLRVFSDIFNKCRQYTSGNRYLEIGIGKGEMLAAALEMGYEVDAVEICKEDCEKISSVLGVDVKWCDFIEFETDKKYDLIIMGDVLEHVSAPMKALKKAQSMLNVGGVLWLSTPNYNSGFTRLKKFTDAMWNQKNHFTYFSYETLLPFLEELDLEVKRYDISNRFNGSMELYCVKKGE